MRTRTLSVGLRPRVVLLHGFGDSADTWRGVLTELSHQGVSALAVDLPGFGEADDLAAGPILPQLDTFLADLITDLRAPVALVGNSLGGTTALRAAQNPDLPLTGVMSIAAPGLHDSWLLRALDLNVPPVWLFAAVPVPGVAIRVVASAVVPRLLYARPSVADPTHVARFTGLVHTDEAAKSLLTKGRRVLRELRDAYRPEDIRGDLAVVVGRRDKLVSVESGRRLHEAVPHSSLQVLDDCGHCPQLDDPAATATLIGAFVCAARDRELVS